LIDLFYRAGKARKMEGIRLMPEKSKEELLDDLFEQISAMRRFPLTYGDKVKELEAEFERIANS
jgi:hypothetical protein